MEFIGRDNQAYTVVRQFDRDGNHTAQLRRSGEQMPLVRGVDAVNEAIVQLGGFTYKGFVDSFYLAQRNLTAPEILKETVKALAGVDALEQITGELEQDMQRAQDTCAALNPQIAEVKEQLTALRIQADTLSTLQAQRRTAVERMTQAETHLTQLQSAAGTLQAALTGVAKQVEQLGAADVHASIGQWHERARQLAETLSDLNAACRAAQTDLTLSTGLTAWLDDFQNRLRAFDTVQEQVARRQAHLAWLLGESDQPHTEAVNRERPVPERRARLNERLAAFMTRRKRMLTGFGSSLIALLIAGSIGGVLSFSPTAESAGLLPNVVTGGLSVMCFVFFVQALVRASDVLDTRLEILRLDMEADRVRNETQTIQVACTLPLPACVTALQGLEDESLAAVVATFTQGPGAPLLEAEAWSAYVNRLRSALSTSENDARSVRERFDAEGRAKKTQIEKHQQEIGRLDHDIAEEQARRERAEQLTQQMSALEDRRTDHERQIAIRRVAKELLTGTHSRLYRRFNLEMQHVVGKIMPLLTNGRYQNLRVNGNLDIQVLSSEKGDFVDLNEISGGTYYQLLLSIRLALSQALIASAVHNAEFIILDEPFAFFDESRTRQTLEALPRISDEISQTWVIAQAFDPEVGFTLHLRCSRDSEVLVASGT